MAAPMISVRGLTLGFATPLIASIDLEVGPGGRVGLTGRSGLGKTIFVEAIVQRAIGEPSPALCGGRIAIADTAIGYSPQRVGIPRWFPVGGLLERLIGRAPVARQADLFEISRRLGLDLLAASYPKTLSGGETQRLSLVMALSFAGDLLILDEPLTALDLATKTELMKVTLSFLERHRIALLVVSHDLDLLISLAQEIHVLAETGIVASVTMGQGRQGELDLTSASAVEARATLLKVLQRHSLDTIP